MRKTKNTNSDFVKIGKFESTEETTTKEPIFTSLDGFTSLPWWLQDGGDINDVEVVYMERNKRSVLESGKLSSFKMKEVKFDLTGLGKYGECIAVILNNKTGRIEEWPFTMVYLKD